MLTTIKQSLDPTAVAGMNVDAKGRAVVVNIYGALVHRRAAPGCATRSHGGPLRVHAEGFANGLLHARSNGGEVEDMLLSSRHFMHVTPRIFIGLAIHVCRQMDGSSRSSP